MTSNRLGAHAVGSGIKRDKAMRKKWKQRRRLPLWYEFDDFPRMMFKLAYYHFLVDFYPVLFSFLYHPAYYVVVAIFAAALIVLTGKDWAYEPDEATSDQARPYEPVYVWYPIRTFVLLLLNLAATLAAWITVGKALAVAGGAGLFL